MPSYVISVYGCGQTRLLRELVGMLTHRGVDVRSLSATFTGEGSPIQIGIEAADEVTVQLLVKRINRIVGVLRVVPAADASAHQRSLTMVRIEANAALRTDVLELSRALDVEVVEATSSSVALSFVSAPDRVQEVVEMFEPFGIVEIVKSSTVVLHRGHRSRGRRTDRMRTAST